MNPQPKHKRIKLSTKELLELKKEKWWAQKFLCPDCGFPIHWNDAHLCHIKSRGAGGDDTFDNVKVKHWFCHVEEHGPRWWGIK